MNVERRDSGVETLHVGLSSAFEDALRPIRGSEGPLGVLFSGGVDSTLLAWELRMRPETELYTLGAEGASDRTAARGAAHRIGLPWKAMSVEEAAVGTAEVRYEAEIEGVPDVVRSVLLTLGLAIEAASPPTLVCGQGADELFLGYAHYRSLGPADAERRAADDLDRLLHLDWPRTQRIAARAGKTVVAPYLAPGFIKEASRVPIELKLPGAVPKDFFRQWAVGRGLPVELSARPKKAAQYGSGVARLLRGRRRNDG